VPSTPAAIPEYPVFASSLPIESRHYWWHTRRCYQREPWLALSYIQIARIGRAHQQHDDCRREGTQQVFHFGSLSQLREETRLASAEGRKREACMEEHSSNFRAVYADNQPLAIVLLRLQRPDGEYEDLVKAGVLDPTKVVRTALTNADRSRR